VEEGGAVLQKGPFGSLPLRRTRLLWCWCPLRSQFTPIVWRPLRGKTHDHVTRTRQPSEGGSVIWTSLGPLPRWVPGATTQWAPGTTRLVPHGT
jgi:hypothetical protein